MGSSLARGRTAEVTNAWHDAAASHEGRGTASGFQVHFRDQQLNRGCNLRSIGEALLARGDSRTPIHSGSHAVHADRAHSSRMGGCARGRYGKGPNEGRAVDQGIAGQTKKEGRETPRSRTQKQAAYPRNPSSDVRVCNALALSGLPTQSDGPDRVERRK